MKRKKYLFLLSLAIVAGLGSCQKAFLEDKPDKALLVPQTLTDLRALLDNINVFNRSPGLTLIADGDFFTTDAGYRTYELAQEQNSYTWAADIYGNEPGFEWNEGYKQILYANVVLEGLQHLGQDAAGQAEHAALEGTALFSRAWANYGLVQMYAPVYQASGAATEPGLPNRLHADVTERVPRGTLAGNYRQITEDLLRARQLLPVQTAFKSRPGRPAVYAMLARVYLSMGNFDLAGRYADSVIQLSPALLDYNTLTASATRPFPRGLPNGNTEILYYSASLSYTFSGASAVAYCDSVLYRSYAASDLRKVMFFRDGGAGKINFKGSYTGAIALFSGLTTDEAYLVRAECAARAGNNAAALQDLNTLLAKRWRSGTYQPFTLTGTGDVLGLVLLERRKELVGRNIRWSDLKRLNTESRFAVTLHRKIGGTDYTLVPGSRRYVYPLPPEEIRLGGLAQNER